MNKASTYPFNQILRLPTHPLRNRHIRPGDPLLRHDGRILKRRLADQKLVRQHPEAPQVHLLIVPIVLAAGPDHLGRQVIERAAQRLAPVIRRVHAPPEIGNLDLPVDAHEDILGLDIPMDNVLAVEVAQRRSHLRNVLRGLPLGEPVLAAQVLVQLALAGELEDQKDALAVVEVAVQLEDVGVSQVALDLNLAANLLLNAGALLEFGFVEDLERADEAAAALAREVDAAEFAFAERPANLEHAEVELLGGEGLLDGEAGGGGGGRGALGWPGGLVGGTGGRCDFFLSRGGRVAWQLGVAALPLSGLGGECDGGCDGVCVL